MKNEVCVFWFRRDLRLHDNAGLYHALKSGNKVLPVFIFDTTILSRLENKNDRRVDFIHQAIENLHHQLQTLGSSIKVYNGHPTEVFKTLINDFKVKQVFTNHDYEPSAIERDREIAKLLKEHGIDFYSFKDQCVFEKEEVLKDDGKP